MFWCEKVDLNIRSNAASEESLWERNIKFNNLHGIAQALVDNMFRPFIGIFAIAVGASNFQIAMLSSLPAIVSSLTMLPGTRLINRSANKKRLTAVLFLLNRIFFLAAAAIPVLPFEYRSLALVLAVGLMNLPGAISIVAWQSLMGQLIPSELRGSAFARRNQLAGMGSLLPTILTGYLLDRLPSPWGYQLIFSVAFGFALIEIYIFMNLKAAGESGANTEQLEEQLCSLTEIAAEKNFFRYMISSLVFYFGWQMAWPLFTLYQVKTLGANNTWIAIYSAIITGVSVLSYPWWGRHADKKGNYATLVLATFGMAISPLMVAVSSNLWILAVFTISMGFFTAGTVLILFNAMLDIAPSYIRTSCVAYYNTLINLSATIAPFVGSAILELSNIYVALAVAALLRGFGTLAFHLARREYLLGK